eukprot:gene1428-6213_t
MDPGAVRRLVAWNIDGKFPNGVQKMQSHTACDAGKQVSGYPFDDGQLRLISEYTEKIKLLNGGKVNTKQLRHYKHTLRNLEKRQMKNWIKAKADAAQ